MTKNGIMVITGNSIQELEADLQAMKVAMATGAQGAVGGSSVADVEKGLKALKSMIPTNMAESFDSKLVEHSCCSCCGDKPETDDYKSGYRRGCRDGHEEGYHQGYASGYENGVNDCYKDGDEDDYADKDETYEEGYSEGYIEGKDAGYEEGRNDCYEELVDDMGLLVELIEEVGVKKVLAALIND